GDAAVGVFCSFTAKTEDEVRDGLAKSRVLFGISGLESFEPGYAGLLELAGLADEAISLGVVHGAHVGLGYRGDGSKNALLTATWAGAVASDESVVVAANHEHVAERGSLRVSRVRAVEEAEVLLRRVGQLVEEGGAGFVLGVDLLGFLDH